MAGHPNVELTRRGYDAFAKGDMAALSEMIAEDVTWHVRGVGPLSSGFQGRDQVFAFFGRLAEETSGTFRLDVHDVLANDERPVALCTLSASRGTKLVEVPVANVSHMRGGKITEFWGATTDPQASIDFWTWSWQPSHPGPPPGSRPAANRHAWPGAQDLRRSSAAAATERKA